MFNAIYKPNQLILGSGYIAICTGWTPAKSVERKLDPSDYAVIGNLYSASRGINFLVRNLLANPHVRYLVTMDLTREDKISGSVQCLKDFFENGVHRGKNDVGKECWVIDSLIKGYIDIDIPLEVLNQLRFSIISIPVSNFEWGIDISSIGELQVTIAKMKSSPQYFIIEPWAEPMVFPYNEPTSEVKPGPLYGHRIEGKTIAETWIKILQRIKTTGTIRPTGYDGKWQELIDLMAIVTDEPEDFYFPDPNYLPLDREYLKNYIPQILDDADYREGVKYTYGQRLRSWFGQDQIEQVINKLIKEIDSASAVMSLWDSGSASHNWIIKPGHERPLPLCYMFSAVERFGREEGDSDHNHGGSPCLNHVWVRVVDNELSLTATFRSNDMFSAWPANAMGLRALQRHIRDEIARQSDYDLTMGPLITISQSAHIYDDCWETVEQLLANQYQSIINQELQNYSDPTGNFLVETSGYNEYNITVSQLTPNGEFVGKWEGKNPLKLIRQIIADCPSIQSFHIGYLAREIERASQQKTNYIQDK